MFSHKENDAQLYIYSSMVSCQRTGNGFSGHCRAQAKGAVTKDERKKEIVVCSLSIP